MADHPATAPPTLPRPSGHPPLATQSIVYERGRHQQPPDHAERSNLARLAWFGREQQLHFVHHLHANSNFGVIHAFWDRLLGTYRSPDRTFVRAYNEEIDALAVRREHRQ